MRSLIEENCQRVAGLGALQHQDLNRGPLGGERLPGLDQVQRRYRTGAVFDLDQGDRFLSVVDTRLADGNESIQIADLPVIGRRGADQRQRGPLPVELGRLSLEATGVAGTGEFAP